MAKRFGRNQRRALREQLAGTEQALAKEIAGRFSENQKYKRQIEQAHNILLHEMKEGRRARNYIKLDLDSIFDPLERRIRYHARVEDLSRRSEPLYSAMQIDGSEADRMSDHERTVWIKLASEEIAKHLLEAMVRHYRTR